MQKPAPHYKTPAKLLRMHLNCLFTNSLFLQTDTFKCVQYYKTFQLMIHINVYINQRSEVQMVGIHKRVQTLWHLFSIVPTGCDWSHPKMTSPKNKAKKKAPKDSMTLLPCFYFVEVCIDDVLLNHFFENDCIWEFDVSKKAKIMLSSFSSFRVCGDV